MLWGLTVLVLFYSWRSLECNIWQCYRDDYLHYGFEKKYDPCCTTVTLGVHSVQYAAGSGLRLLFWRSCTSKRSKVQQGIGLCNKLLSELFTFEELLKVFDFVSWEL